MSTARLQPVAEADAPLQHLELFGGAGGLALGLRDAGLLLSRLIEVDAEACDTLRRNGRGRRRATRGWAIDEKSVADVSFSNLGAVDVVSAGAPCQPFSHGGQRAGDLDTRNLFPYVVQAIGELQPRAFIIENVRGLLFGDMELYFRRLLRELRTPSRQLSPPQVGRPRGRPRDEYRVFYKLLNAADFGLPQNRLRLFIVGLKPELAHRWAWPEPTHGQDALLQALLDEPYWEAHRVPSRVRREVRARIARATRQRLERNPSPGCRWKTVRDLLAKLPAPSSDPDIATDQWHLFVPNARLYARHTGSRLDWPAKTVKAGVHGCPGGEHIVVFDDGSHRYFSVRECALLQGFPPRYAFPLHRSQAMRQIGNAVPIPVATAVGRELVKALRDEGGGG